MKPEQEKVTTKACPKCGNTYLGLIRTQNKKYCSDCNTWFDWFLDKDQKPLL
jgi:protein-arginine kinase activator protein McsA